MLFGCKIRKSNKDFQVKKVVDHAVFFNPDLRIGCRHARMFTRQ